MKNWRISSFFCLLFCRTTQGLRRIDPRKPVVQAEQPKTLTSRKIVLNLNRRTDRLGHFLTFLAANDRVEHFTENWCRLSAYDGSNKQWIDSIIERGHLSEFGRATVERAFHGAFMGGWPVLTPGAVGSYESHMHAMKVIMDSNVSFGIVAEDDLAEVSPDFQEMYHLLQKPETWKNTDLIYLQYDDPSWSKEWLRKPDTPTTLIDKSGQQVFNTGMYAISRLAATKLMGEASPLLPIEKQFDAVIPAGVRWLRVKAFSPPIAQSFSAEQNGSGIGRSDIQWIKDTKEKDFPLNTSSLLPECE